MKARDRLIVALDVDTMDKALGLVDQLSGDVGIFKIGIAPFTAFGHELIKELKARGKKIFLDLKVHDIPNTARQAAAAAAEQGVFMMNFHCLGGLHMLEAAFKGVQETGRKAILLGVTILTSMSEEDTSSIGLVGPVADSVIRLAGLASQARFQGVVASAREAGIIKQRIGRDFLVVSPGIRPDWSTPGDQKRGLTPREAVKQGVDYIVVGRPVTGAEDPSEAAGRIIKEMEA